MANNVYNNFNEKQYKFSYWYVSHKLFLRRLAIVILGLLAFSFLFYGLFSLVDYYIISAKKINQLEQSLSQTNLNYELINQINQPQELAIGEAKMLISSKGKYDFFVEVNNLNTNWFVESFDYYFTYGDNERTETKTDFILPSSRKFLYNLNFESIKKYNDISIVIENIKWKKVSNYQSLSEKFLQILIKEVKLDRPAQLNQGELLVTNLSFDLINRSAYNFWQPKFIILLYQGSQVIGINQVVLNSFDSNEMVHQSINFFQNLPLSIKVEIIPDIDILDPTVFKGFSVDSGELK